MGTNQLIMKKVLFLFIISLFTCQTLSFAQFDKGKFLVIGSLDFTNETLKYDNNQIAGSNSTIIYPIFVRETSFELNPTLGYFVSDLWAIGLSGGIGFGNGLIKYSPSSLVDESVGKTNTASLGVFMRKYWVWTDKFSLFAELSAKHNWGSTRQKKNNSSSQEANILPHTYTAQTSLGLNYQIIPKLGVELNIPILSYSSFLNGYNYGMDPKSKSWNFAFADNIRLGFNLLF